MDQKTLQSNIIQTLGIEAMEDSKKVAMLENITALVEKRILLRVLEQLDKEKYAEISSAEGDENMLQKLVEHVPNLDELAVEEIVKIKEELGAMISNDPNLAV